MTISASSQNSQGRTNTITLNFSYILVEYVSWSLIIGSYYVQHKADTFHVKKPTPPGANDITSGVYLLPEYSWSGVMERVTVRAHIVGIIYMVERAEVEVGEGHCTHESSWAVITWYSPLSDAILMTQRSIASLP